VNLSALTDHEAATSSGVEHGNLLLAFAEAMVRDDEAALTHTRHAVIEVLSPEAMVSLMRLASS
jgi:hypothetical protein